MFKRISVSDVQSMNESEDIQFVDIRDEASFAAGHIPGSFHLGQHNLQQYIESADLDKPLMVCCYHGNSSQSAAQFLHEKGFDDVYSIDGGFEAWKLNNPVESGSN
ncbi:Thiosulfate sulfurtransferase GlpE [BD1-7 clade bacterium]|uniref:Thiosulfate sulfurtransferase GlpE n=1 Tax=BD1-7 clade bacterium TaxID=2029982 RepID=A0A5S9NMN2_9GAMM|nr:Thiosulfate sulfurtransferase GlpE [BD1-7 clade bacterium]CAA0094011.1 Thiosulfate sulfurtransferase GlpE [BD1-7 clade bacterium]CAA0097191.1 Thiosulfate sulfurtransferase GlpE [BD1-7 clade bacterium]CAA0122602.1 Thiosulfate sulfurtransferase GlpE [BD1-7 clade bacterium]